jgi:FkbM family methyltransferase
MQCQLEIPGLPDPLLFHVHSGDNTFVSKQIFKNRIWEPFETSVIVNHLKKGDVFLDIGANIGYFSVVASTLVGASGKVIAYEPDENNFRLLEKNIAVNGLTNTRLFNAAVSDCSSSGYIYLCEDNEGDHRIYDCGEGRERTGIEIVHGNDHIPRVTDRLDFIKIDTQGSEAHILKGMDKVIQANKDHLAMVIEFWPHGLKQSGASGRELLDMISAFDFDLSMIDTNGRRLIPINVAGLRSWVEEMDSDPKNEGFMDLFLTSQTLKS